MAAVLLLCLLVPPAEAGRESRLAPIKLQGQLFSPGAQGHLFTHEVVLRNLSAFPQTVTATVENESIGLGIKCPGGDPGAGWIPATQVHWYDLASPVPAFRTAPSVEVVVPALGFSRVNFSVCCTWRPTGGFCQPFDDNACPGSGVPTGDIHGAQGFYEIGRVILRVAEDRGGVVASVSLKATIFGQVTDPKSEDFQLLFNGGRPF